MIESGQIDKKYKNWIIALSVIIPVLVAALFRVKVDGYDMSFLPAIYASINGFTAICLIAALLAIKNGNKGLHEGLMKLCIGLSALFLLLYVLYHITSESTTFGGEGVIRPVYFAILISHIILSIAVVPLVLFTFAHALSNSFEKHKKLARITFPIWLYVAISGVVVYLLISPYY